jgi:hypothetical protein
MNTSALINYHPSFPQSLLAQGQGQHFIQLIKLDELYTRADRKKTRYQIHYRELSADCENESDEAYVCVLSSENTYWLPAELLVMGINVRHKIGTQIPADFNIFDHVMIM